MRINKNTDSTLFIWYDLSKSYRSMSTANKQELAERLVKTYDIPIDSYARVYCYHNGIEASTASEQWAYWLRYNMKINDMLYSHFHVEYISDSFYQVASHNTFKLLNTAEDMGGIYDCLGLCSGTMIFADYAVQYAIREDGVFVTTDYRDADKGGGKLLTIFSKDAISKSGIERTMGKTIKLERKEQIEAMPELSACAYIALAILILKKCGDIETQIIGANVRRKSLHSDEIIMNATPFPIVQVDSTWLRTIIRTEGFLVRGHFRLQACGERHLERKLIYIKPFQKHGYVRRAGRLIAEERAFVSA